MFVSALQFLQRSSVAPAAQQHAIIGSAIGAFSVAAYATWYSIQHDGSAKARAIKKNEAELAKNMKGMRH